MRNGSAVGSLEKATDASVLVLSVRLLSLSRSLSFPLSFSPSLSFSLLRLEPTVKKAVDKLNRKYKSVNFV
jgi:hypothetical protein